MKILFYSLNYAPELTATGKYTGEMAAWFASRGHEVHAITGMPHYPQWSLHPQYAPARSMEEKLGNVSVRRIPHYIPHSSDVGASSRIRMDLSFIMRSFGRWWAVITGRESYDLVILVCPPIFTSIYPVLYKLLRGVPWVIHIQDIQIDVAIRLGLIRNGLLKRLLYILEKRILQSASLISTISNSMCNSLTAKAGMGANIVLTPNWANPAVLIEVANNTFRRDHGIPEWKILVMYSGNLGRKQGVEILLDVSERLKDNSNLHFVLVGDGAARDEISDAVVELQADNLTMLPVQPAEALPTMLQAADIHLVIQKHEASDSVLPSKLTNILASGKPCVVTATEDTELASIVTTNRVGIAVEPDSAALLAESIEALGRDRVLAAEYGRNARQYASKNLEIDMILKSFERQLQMLATR